MGNQRSRSGIGCRNGTHEQDLKPLFPRQKFKLGRIQKIYFLCGATRSGAGLVQQTVQIVASLRSHDLTLFVGRLLEN